MSDNVSNHSFVCIPSAGTALPSTKNGNAHSIGKIIDWDALLIVSRVKQRNVVISKVEPITLGLKFKCLK